MKENDKFKLNVLSAENKSSDDSLKTKRKTRNETNPLEYIALSEQLKNDIAKPDKPITKEEVAKHNKKDDAWVIYKNKVYEITHYLKHHPGGKKILLGKSGKDVTKKVNKMHPYVNVEEILKHSFIGYLEE
ncbi:cytochrome b5-like heme/steroid binding protein, putative [Plasmodium gaboni]|uniref:Cytochrome b5-like heme/steroid binding protein, putative n=2 Tax=Plasmodium gaboni TaxID=647221 RepID=A0ABY1ULY8_9APIC|nr:cytochrome b5-like heme/steroid binding protein, putative [Plasmodium gaboni]